MIIQRNEERSFLVNDSLDSPTSNYFSIFCYPLLCWQLILRMFDWVLNVSLREKCPNTELLPVRFFLYSDWIRRFTPNAWKVSKYGVISGPYFPVFGLNTGIYSVNRRIQSEHRKVETRNNSVFGHFSRSVFLKLYRKRAEKLTWLSNAKVVIVLLKIS